MSGKFHGDQSNYFHCHDRIKSGSRSESSFLCLVRMQVICGFTCNNTMRTDKKEERTKDTKDTVRQDAGFMLLAHYKWEA